MTHVLLAAGPAAAAPDGETARMSVGTAGEQADDESGPPVISADGRFVAFASRASLPVAVDPQPPGDDDNWKVYVRDRRAPGRTLWVSHPAADVSPEDLSISGDGRLVAFTTRSRLAEEDFEETAPDLYVHDRDADGDGSFDGARRTILVTGPDAGISNFEPAGEPDFSADGRSIGYTIRQSPTPGDISAWTAKEDPDSGRFIGWESATRLVDFGEDAESQHRVIYLRNLSPEPLRLDDIKVVGLQSKAFSITGNGCPAVLRPGGACGLVLTFDRRFPPGVYHALLKTDSPERLGRTQVALAATQRCPLGEACRRAPLDVSSTALKYSDTDQRDKRDLTLTISNRSTDRVIIAAILIKGQHPKWFRPLRASTCKPGTVMTGRPQSTPPLPIIDDLPVVTGSQCELTVRFSPKKLGVGNATLLVKTSAGVVQPVRLFGVGVRPVVHVSRQNREGAFDEAQVVSINHRGKAVEGRRPSLSDDGRYIAYDSIDRVKRKLGRSRYRDVYIRDMAGEEPPALASRERSRTRARLLQILAGGQRLGHAFDPSLSGDGSRVAFTAQVRTDPSLLERLPIVGRPRRSPVDGVFVRDLDQQITLRADVASATQAANGRSGAPALSADGRTLAFHSAAANLVEGDGNKSDDVFTRDLLDAFTGAAGEPVLQQMSVDSGGREGNADSTAPAISADGRYVALLSEADNLVSGDTNKQPDDFLRDRQLSVVLVPSVIEFGLRTIDHTSEAKVATLRNTGSDPIQVGGTIVTGPAAGDFETVSRCPDTLRPRASCTIDILFTASEEGDRRAELRVDHSGPGSASTARLNGAGKGIVDPPVEIEPSELDFGSRTLRHTSPPQTATVINKGAEPVDIDAITLTKLAADDYEVVDPNTCDRARLAPGESCTLDIEFTPLAVGKRDAILRVEHSAADTAATARLTGVGTPQPDEVFIRPDPVEFGTLPVGHSSDPKTARLINESAEPVDVERISITRKAGRDYRLLHTPCTGTRLQPTESCRIDLEFTPSEVGDRNAILAAGHSAGVSTAELLGAGEAVTPSDLVFEPPELDFGKRTVKRTTETQATTLVNKGPTAVEVSKVFIGGHAADDYDIARTTCTGARLEPSGSCTIDVQFTASAEGEREAAINAKHTGSNGRSAGSLVGFGLPEADDPVVTLEPEELDFGTHVVDRISDPQTATLTNTGTEPVEVTGIGFTRPASRDYDLVDPSCRDATLGPAESCTIDVQFTPTEAGNRPAVLVVDHSASDEGSAIDLTGIGEEVPPPHDVVIEPEVLEFEPRLIGDTSPPQDAKLVNKGTEPVDVSTITVIREAGDDYEVITECDDTRLAPGASCPIAVQFTPSAKGERLAVLRADHSASELGSTAQLSGIGKPPTGLVRIKPGSLDFGTRGIDDTSPPQTVEVINEGSAPVDIGPITTTKLAAGDYEVMTHTCGTLAPDSSCTIDVEFTPLEEGVRDAILRVEHTGKDGLAAADLTGIGEKVTPPLTINPSPVDFGEQTVGRTSPPQRAQVTNDGLVPAEITSVAVTRRDGLDFRLPVDGCTAMALLPGESCAVDISFTPSEPQHRDGILRVEDSLSETPATTHLTGTGVPPGVAKLVFNPRAVNFGNQVVGVASPPRTVTLVNEGTAPVDVDDVRTTGRAADDYRITGTTCRGSRLEPAGRCTVDVRFVPATRGDRPARLAFDHSGMNSPVEAELTGTGVRDESRIVVLEPRVLDFGSRTVHDTSPPRRATLSNRGTLPIDVDEVTISGPAADDYEVTGKNCEGIRLEPGASCPIDVEFTPSTADRRDATLGVAHSGPDGGSTSDLTGVGVAPPRAVTLEPDPVAFGDQVVNTTSPTRVARLTNRGTEPIDVGEVTKTRLAAPDFRIIRTDCKGARLQPGASCTVSVRFRPSTLGERLAVLSVAHSGPGGASRTALIGTGVPRTQPGLVSSPDPADLGEGRLGQRTRSTRITLTSIGTEPVSISALRLGGEHRTDFLIAATTCRGTTLPTGATCTVDVVLRATAVGERVSVLSVRSTAPDSPLRNELQGVGLPPELTIDPEVGPTRLVPVVSGEGFPPGESVPLRWRLPDGADLPGTAIARVRDDGTFDQQLLVLPKDLLGPREAVTSDERWGEATADYLVVPGTIDPPRFLSRN